MMSKKQCESSKGPPDRKAVMHLYNRLRGLGFESPEDEHGAGLRTTDCEVTFALLNELPIEWEITVVLPNGKGLRVWSLTGDVRDNTVSKFPCATICAPRDVAVMDS